MKNTAGPSSLFIFLVITIKQTLSLSLSVDLSLNLDGTDASIVNQYSNPVDPEFMSLSIEWNHLPEAFLIYAQGQPTGQINQFAINLLRNLAAGVRYQGSPTLRVGGNSAQLMWWSQSNLTRPPTANLTVAPIALGLMDRVATATSSRLVPDISMLLQDPSASLEFLRTGVLSNINYRNLLAVELGNEPEFWVRKQFRPANWSYTVDFINDFISFTNTLINNVPTLPKTFFWGPAMSSNGNLTTFIASNQQSVTGFTFHRYALSGCADDPNLVNVPLLLQDPQPDSYNYLFNALNTAAAMTGVSLNIGSLIAGEINSVSCGGVDGVSNVFGAAIWGLDNFLTLAHLNIHKICIHGAQGDFRTNSSADHTYAPWVSDLHSNVVHVRPIYYSMLFFNRIIGSANSTIRAANFTVTDIASNQSNPNVKLWLVKNGNGGYALAILNKDLSLPAINLAINASNIQTMNNTPVMVERMIAPNVYSRTGISIAGMTLDGSNDGLPVGNWQTESLSTNSTDGLYRITVNSGSVAVMYLAGNFPNGPVGASLSSGVRSSPNSILIMIIMFVCWMML